MQTVREFAQEEKKEVAPFIKEWDEKQEFTLSLKKMRKDLCWASASLKSMAAPVSDTSIRTRVRRA